ncbi:MAG TPA: hypothetical protein VMA34_08820 [Terracidiphilus sp.]|nr:hypothetical protein [Terracidiphilus sp.]
MASERDEVLKAVVEQETTQPTKLETAISDASNEAERTKRLELEQKHALAKLHAELGVFGRIFGGEPHAPIVIAFIVVVFGLLTSAGLWWFAFQTGSREFWSGEAHIALGAATTALGYVFGRGSKGSSK